jgi:hypothetical protein
VTILTFITRVMLQLGFDFFAFNELASMIKDLHTTTSNFRYVSFFQE